MSDVSGIAEKHLPYIMVLAGLGMFVGNLIGGKLTDAFSPSVIVIAVLVFQIVCMMTIYYTATNAGISCNDLPYRSYHFCTCTFTYITIAELSKSDAEMLVASLGPACFNIANALGLSLVAFLLKRLRLHLSGIGRSDDGCSRNCNIYTISTKK